MSELIVFKGSNSNKDYNVGFATLNEISDIAEWDQALSSAQILWKLQHNEIIIARKDERIVGFIRLEYLWSKYPYIGLIRVERDRQRQGVGKQLLAFAENHLASRGLNRLYSSSQVDEAEPQQWHRHVGFKECGIINGINDGIGEILFVKELTLE
ncbi:GNAT family N-acetyltransferase [Cohnella endophytica]|uniref:GNAT family N-acetyltransferase n=1 Tax=Cohnella endophytica TaxID=2419778 RepID=UPI001314D0F6|nr:GNAT family N-acetyltransferase [Cohnella endophytica]